MLLPYIPDFPKFSNSNDKSIVSLAFIRTFPLTLPFTFNILESFHLLLVKEFPDNSPINLLARILPFTVKSFLNKASFETFKYL